MSWRVKCLIGLLTTSLALLSIAGFINSQSYRAYLIDLEDNRHECQAERHTDGGKKSKDCQTVLYQTFDDPVALLTGGLLIATFALFVVTYFLYAAASGQGADAKDAIQAAKDSAIAARQSAELAQLALEKEQSPYLYPKFTLVSPDKLNPPADMGWAGFVLADFRNYGKSPAYIISTELEVVLGETLDIIKTNLAMSQRHGHVEIIGEGETARLDEIAIGRNLLEIVEGSSTQMYKFLKVHGCVRYSDIIGDEYIMSIVYCLSFPHNSFSRWGGPRHNRRRKLTREEIESQATITLA